MRTSLIFLLFALSTPAMAAPSIDPAKSAPALIGRWMGDAQVVVNWCDQKKIALDLTIHADGQVTGKLGDAEIRTGSVIPRSARSLATRWLYNTEYLIRVELSGPLVAAEGIHRDSARILVSKLEDARLTGGIHTSGKHIVPSSNREELKKKMMFSATRLTLTRVEEIKQ